VAGFFGGVITLLIIAVLSFYMVVEDDAAKRLFRHLAPADKQEHISGLIQKMQEKIGAWLRGELVLMFIIGLVTYIGLVVLGVEYALVLAIIAGVSEIVPYAGPIIATVPAVAIAFTQSPILGLMVLVLYFLIQQLENNFLVPKVMQKATGLNPVISLVVLLIGFKVGGVMGAVLAIPVTTMIAVFLSDYFNES